VIKYKINLPSYINITEILKRFSMTTAEAKTSLISAEVCAEIDRWLTKYPADRKRSAVLIALRLVQEQNGGWLTTELMDAVAEYLQLAKIAVYEVASFYSMYEHKPVGKYKIAVCNSLPCMLRGSENIIHHLEKRLCIKEGETTPDGRYTLKEAECLAACVNAPMLQINFRDIHEDLTVEKVDAMLADIDSKEASRG
jgi:NADH-quinone oxidoreductase subunit E